MRVFPRTVLIIRYSWGVFGVESISHGMLELNHKKSCTFLLLHVIVASLKSRVL